MHIPVELCRFYHFRSLLITNLENIKFQIITLVCCPKDWVVAGLGPVFHLAETLVGAGGGFADGFREELRGHKMGAGAGGQVAAVLHQLKAS